MHPSTRSLSGSWSGQPDWLAQAPSLQCAPLLHFAACASGREPTPSSRTRVASPNLDGWAQAPLRASCRHGGNDHSEPDLRRLFGPLRDQLSDTDRQAGHVGGFPWTLTTLDGRRPGVKRQPDKEEDTLRPGHAVCSRRAQTYRPPPSTWRTSPVFNALVMSRRTACATSSGVPILPTGSVVAAHSAPCSRYRPASVH